MIQYNPLLNQLGEANGALISAPDANLVFDLPGKAIWAKGVKLKGTDHTYTFSNDNYITLTPTPGVDDATAVLIGVSILNLLPQLDKVRIYVGDNDDTQAFLGAITNPYVKLFYDTTRQQTFLIKSPDNNLSIITDADGNIVIKNEKPDINHNTDFLVYQSEGALDQEYRILLKRLANNNPETSQVMFSQYLRFNPDSKTLKIDTATVAHSLNIVDSAPVLSQQTATTIATIAGVTISASLPTYTNSYQRPVYLGGVNKLSNIDTIGLNFAGQGIIYLPPGTETEQSGSNDYGTFMFTGIVGTGTLSFKIGVLEVASYDPTLNVDTVLTFSPGNTRGSIAMNNRDIEVFGPVAFIGDADEDSLIMPQFDAAVHCVHTIPQVLTNEQRQTARNNIGAISAADLPNTVQQALALNDMDRPILLKNGGGTATIISTTIFSGVTVNTSTNTLKATSVETSGRIITGGSLILSSSSYSAIFTHSGSAITLALDDTPDPKNILTIAVPNGNIIVNYETAFNGQIVSNVDNAAPFVITSTTLNSNLNADLLDGKHLNEIFTVFEDAGNQVTRLVIGGVPLTCNIDADTVDGLHVHAGVNSEANKIVRTNASGNLVTGLINTTTDNLGNTDTGKVYLAASGSNDIKYKPFADFLNEIRGAETIEITKNLAPTTSWAATGIATTDLDTGTYIVQLSTGNHYFSGVMSWYYNINGMAEEINLHYAGSGSPIRVYLRTYNGTLEIAADSAWSATDFVFKFKKEIL